MKLRILVGLAVLLLCSPFCAAEEVSSADTPPAPDHAADGGAADGAMTLTVYQSLDLTVCDAAGTPVPGAQVTVDIDGVEGGSGTTDQTGRIRLSQLSSRFAYTLRVHQEACGSTTLVYRPLPETPVGEDGAAVLTLKLPKEAPAGLYTPPAEEAVRNPWWLVGAIGCSALFLADGAAALIVGLRGRKGKYQKEENEG